MQKDLTRPRVACVIPARMSSGRFPGKPLAKIAGRELILRVADIAVKSRRIEDVIVATEDLPIQRVCQDAGFQARLTSQHLTCTHRVAEVARGLPHDHIVNLQGDEPLMDPCTLDAIIDYHIAQSARVTQATYPVDGADIADHDCVKCVVNNGKVILLTRQPELIAANLFGIAGLYVYDRETICNFPNYDLTLVEACGGLDTFGFIGKVDVVPFMLPSRTLAVDRPEDVKKIEACLGS